MDEQKVEARGTAEAVGDIEIPVPDYDDIPLEDDVSDVTDAIPSITIDDVSSEPVSPIDVPTTTSPQESGEQSPVTQPVTQQPQQQQQLLPDDTDADDEARQEKCNFELARAKLEAFSRDEQRVLAGTIARDPNMPEPDPDYSDDDDLADDRQEAGATYKMENPAAAATKEQQSLVKELARRQKLGLNVLNKKSELDKEFEKRKVRQQQREDEENRRKHRSSFDIRMEEQANKIILAEQQQQQQQQAADSDDSSQPEFLKVHSKINKIKLAS